MPVKQGCQGHPSPWENLGAADSCDPNRVYPFVPLYTRAPRLTLAGAPPAVQEEARLADARPRGAHEYYYDYNYHYHYCKYYYYVPVLITN